MAAPAVERMTRLLSAAMRPEAGSANVRPRFRGDCGVFAQPGGQLAGALADGAAEQSGGRDEPDRGGQQDRPGAARGRRASARPRGREAPAASSRARVIPGRMRPSAGGVSSAPSPSSIQTFAHAASSTAPSRSTASQAGSCGRSSHLCAPSPPASARGSSATSVGAPRARACASTATVAVRRRAARRRRPVGRRRPASSTCGVEAVERARRSRPAARGGASALDGRAVAHGDRLQQARARGRAARGQRGGGAAGAAGARLGHAARRARAAIGAALPSASRSSACGSESATIPPPQPSQARPPRDLERADGDVELQPRVRAREADRARVGLALGALEVGDHLQRLDLRRARDRAGRERGAHAAPRRSCPRAARARTSRDQVPQARVRLGADRRRARRCPSARRARGRCARGRRSSRAPPRPWPRRAARPAPAVARRGALDRRGDDLVAAAAQEQLGREATGPRGPRRGRGTRRGAARAPRRPARTPRRRLPRSAPSRRSVTLAWNSSPAAIRSTHSATAATWRPSAPGAGSSAVERERRGGAPQPAPAAAAPARRAPRTTTRPSAVLPQHVVVEAEARDRAAAPAAAAAAAAARSPRRARSPGSRTSRRRPPRRPPPRPVEHVERRGALHDADRARAHDRARARPLPDQRERARVVAHGAQHVRDGGLELERDPDRRHPPSVADAEWPVAGSSRSVAPARGRVASCGPEHAMGHGKRHAGYSWSRIARRLRPGCCKRSSGGRRAGRVSSRCSFRRRAGGILTGRWTSRCRTWSRPQASAYRRWNAIGITSARYGVR